MYEYKEAISVLIDNFPELRKVYEENIDDYKELPYVFYESVFFKFIMNTVYSYDEEKLKAIFSFIEDMLKNGDKEIKNLIEVAIIESLYYEENSKAKELLAKYFGPLTKESYKNCFLK
ncbi:MAG TPA: hypothetical protein PLW34_08155 [Termitinemataceae bacterium]|nr:hypothetical protein [Termitinemataceae bacterium]HOM23781.1 hypothetical protein [Termitinemataceae bacterium]HPQ00821.1 hypothetical protein [Termitinemataceae bacterium]